MVNSTLTRGQRQTQKARDAYAARFPSPEAKTEYYRELSKRAAAARITLSAEEVSALAECYDLLRRIAARHPKIASPDKETTAGGEPAVQEAVA